MDIRKTKNYQVILSVLLTGITIFSLCKYLLTLKEKYGLTDSLSRAKGQIAALEQEVIREKTLQRALSQEDSALKDELKANADKFAQLDIDLRNAENSIQQLSSQITLSQAENAALKQEKDKLTQELTQASQERDALKEKLNSIKELKKAIREVKKQIRLAKAKIREITRERRIVEGNRGFLIRGGMSTYNTGKVKIEVMPIPSDR